MEPSRLLKLFNAALVCLAIAAPAYLLATWADVAPIVRTIAHVVFFTLMCAMVVAMYVTVSTKGEHFKRGFPRSRMVVVVITISALFCSVLPYRGIDQAKVVKFEGLFEKVFIEDSNYRIVFFVDGASRKYRIEYQFGDRVQKRLKGGEMVFVEVEGNYVCRLVTNGVEVLSLEEYVESAQKAGWGMGVVLMAALGVYWFVASYPDKSRAKNVSRKNSETTG